MAVGNVTGLKQQTVPGDNTAMPPLKTKQNSQKVSERKQKSHKSPLFSTQPPASIPEN